MSERLLVAVSGGVDSVVLLDMLVARKFSVKPFELVVAHFDHGIRDNSALDAIFVGELAEKYGLPFEIRREELGKNASEELARDRRYMFLRSLAEKHDAKVVTAHHADDVIETIAINMTRGTGWRGLAVLDSPDIWRPLLDLPKAALLDYAQQHGLAWHEDSTNTDTTYLRNNLRKRLDGSEDDTKRLVGLYRDRQVVLKASIDSETLRLIGESPYSRHLFIASGHNAAMEMLRAVLMKETGQTATRPQLDRALHAIKVLQLGKRFEVSKAATFRFTKTHFVVEQTRKVLS